MAGKITSMSQIKQLLLLKKEETAIRKMARATGLSRNTVRDYLAKLMSGGWAIDELLKLSDPELEARFHAGNPAYSDNRFDLLKVDLDYYCKEHKTDGIQLILLYEEYQAKHPNVYSYSQFCYHISQHTKKLSPSMVLEHKPADKLFVDFSGRTREIVDRVNGEVTNCQLFIATLPFSDYGFVFAVKSQKVEDFIYALIKALTFFGGAPIAIVPDNLKAAVIKASRYEPTLNEAFEQAANYFGMTIVPARAYKPKDKALVENHVRLVYSRVLDPLRKNVYYSIEELNEALATTNQKLNQRRRQKHPQTREEQFLSSEKALLSPLPSEPYEQANSANLTVQKNGHVYLTPDNHYYSVPYMHIGEKTTVIFTRTLVTVYVKNQPVAVHVRSHQTGRYSTITDHLCSAHKHYAERSPDYYLLKAEAVSDVVRGFVQGIFDRAKHPEQAYRSCDGILNLARKAKKDEKISLLNQACQDATQLNRFSYNLLCEFYETALKTPQLPIDFPSTPMHDNVRGKEYFQNQS